METVICIVCSVVISIITATVTTKILATRYFELVDSHVEDICDMTKDFVEYMKQK